MKSIGEGFRHRNFFPDRDLGRESGGRPEQFSRWQKFSAAAEEKLWKDVFSVDSEKFFVGLKSLMDSDYLIMVM